MDPSRRETAVKHGRGSEAAPERAASAKRLADDWLGRAISTAFLLGLYMPPR
jgi:hypothetical protein